MIPIDSGASFKSNASLLVIIKFLSISRLGKLLGLAPVAMMKFDALIISSEFINFIVSLLMNFAVSSNKEILFLFIKYLIP